VPATPESSRPARWVNRGLRDAFVDRRFGRGLAGILMLTVLMAAQMVFERGDSPWVLLVPVAPLACWVMLRAMRGAGRHG
jgi:hypothetical protein